MELIKEYVEHDKIFSCLNSNKRTIRIYKRTIEEIKSDYRRSEYMTFEKRTDKNFIFSFIPYVKKENVYHKEMSYKKYAKSEFVGVRETIVDYDGAKEYKLCPINHEYIQFDEKNNFVKYGQNEI